jgi:long-chain alkane monooxygenase
LDRRRFLDLRSRPAGSPHRERCRPQRDGQRHPRRSRPGLDRAREVAQHVGIGGAGPVAVGTPEKVADAIETWFDQTDVDGLNVPFAVSPGDFEDIADTLVPELVRRGRYKAAYQPGTLREKLFGAGRARLAAPHPAVRYRRHMTAKAAE